MRLQLCSWYALLWICRSSAQDEDCPSKAGVELDADIVSLLQIAKGSAHIRRAEGDLTKPSVVYPWSQRGRGATTSSSTPYSAPSDFADGPTWTWPNDLDEQVRHSPLIDDNLDIYVTTATRIRKFTSDGSIIWTWQSDKKAGKIVSSPALYDGSIFVAAGAGSNDTAMYSIDMHKGTINWRKTADLSQNDDASSVFVHSNTMIIPAMSKPEHGLNKSSKEYELKKLEHTKGNNVMYAVNASSGAYLWEHHADDVFANFAPATPGDGTFIVASNCGGIFKLSFDGKVIWRKGDRSIGHLCSSGGGALGSNGVFYVEYDDVTQNDTGAQIAAYQVSDGKQLWKQTLTNKTDQGLQYPAVGRLGSGGPLAVVVAVGQPTSKPPDPELDENGYSEQDWYDWKVAEKTGVKPTKAPAPKLHNSVIALDAASGKVLWRFDEEPWQHVTGAGEGEKFQGRKKRSQKDPRVDVLCMPGPQGIPVIAGDGTVYTSSGHSGDLHAIKDTDGNGVISKDEISTFSTHNCFRNSPSIAPGMLVAAPCWGPMYVFKDRIR